MPPARQYPVTPDGRYFVVDGRLWRTSNPALAPEVRQALVDALMRARRQVGVARRSGSARPSADWANAARSGGPTARRISIGEWRRTRRMPAGLRRCRLATLTAEAGS
jgi:hypothetical protein